MGPGQISQLWYFYTSAFTCTCYYSLSEKEKEIEELKAEVARKISEVSSKDTETSSLKTDIENKKVQLSSLQKDLDIQKQKNNVSLLTSFG